jgi:hypothetical protein
VLVLVRVRVIETQYEAARRCSSLYADKLICMRILAVWPDYDYEHEHDAKTNGHGQGGVPSTNLQKAIIINDGVRQCLGADSE